MRFIAIDLETANPRMSSICQIGIVTFEDGREVDAEAILVNPHDYFDPYNVAIHGINAEHVSSAPAFFEIHSKLCELTSGQIVACHTHFDRVALAQACGKHSLDPLPCNWLDTARVARRAFSQFSRSGYGLANLAKHFGITFKHHDALHDARTAGLILLKAIERCYHKGRSVQASGYQAKVPSKVFPVSTNGKYFTYIIQWHNRHIGLSGRVACSRPLYQQSMGYFLTENKNLDKTDLCAV